MGRTGRADGQRHDQKKSPWMATVFEAKDGRLATGATIEPSAAEKGSAGRKMLVERRGGHM